MNSARPLPRDFPSSGSFFGPKTSSATMKIRINSGIPMEPNMFCPLAGGDFTPPPDGPARLSAAAVPECRASRREPLESTEVPLFCWPRPSSRVPPCWAASSRASSHASPERDTPSLDEYADILTTLSDWAPEPIAPGQDRLRLDPRDARPASTRTPPSSSRTSSPQMKEKQHGSFYGLGIQIQKRMGKITVIAPMEGTPAYKMGIRAGRRHHAHRRRGAQGRHHDRGGRPQAPRPQGHRRHHHAPPGRLRRADQDDDHAGRDPDEVGALRLHARAGRRLHHAVRLHAHLEPRALRGDREAREAGHEEAALRPARQPGRRPRAGGRRHRTSSCPKGSMVVVHAGPHGLLGPGVLRSRRRRPLRPAPRRARQPRARPRPRRSSPARSRTTTAA